MQTEQPQPTTETAGGASDVERVVRPIAVLAGTRNEFVEYKRLNNDKRLVFCDRWPEFAGLEFSEFVEVGTFGSRNDALVIYQRVLPMVRPNDRRRSMTVAELISYLQMQPQDLQVAYRCCSEQALLEAEEIKITEACEPRPDGWIQNKRPDKTTQEYLMFPGN